MKIKVINGPNINLTGKRSPVIYGSESLEEINSFISEKAALIGVSVSFFQSNSEGAIIDALHSSLEDGTAAVLLNAGAYTHYSYAVRDAVEALSVLGIPTYEVHLSDPDEREPFRRVSVIRDVCRGVFKGKGKNSYTEALEKAYKDLI